ncbi:hypothetical protein NL676_005723 [Syzygium grande]|nr:hypothetical protein NL676_005723 [Syzygium grande]
MLDQPSGFTLLKAVASRRFVVTGSARGSSGVNRGWRVAALWRWKQRLASVLEQDADEGGSAASPPPRSFFSLSSVFSLYFMSAL